MSSNSPHEAQGPPPGTSPPESRPGRPAPPPPEAIDAFCLYLRRLEVDPELDWAAFLAEHEEHAAELELLLDQYERVSAILERLTPAASFSARLREHYGEGVDPGISLSGDQAREGSSRREGSSGSGQLYARLSAQGPNTGRYELRQEIARGGMGAILEVWDRELRRTLAMKVVLGGKAAPDSSESSADVAERRLSRFLEEAQITGQLDHPGIVPVHDIGIDDQARVYFTMPLIDGHDLRKVFEMARMEKGGWDLSRVISVFVRVCEAMAFSHSKHVVHRDLKPANIMVGAFGEAYVMDWGLAKVQDRIGPERPPEAQEERAHSKRERRVRTDRSEGSTTAGSSLKTLDGDIVGTPSYMAPEQARGKLEEVGPHSDIYSMGAMLYHLLAGNAPFEPLGERVPAHSVLEAVRKAPPWPLQRVAPEVDGELAAICEKAMARDQKLRYESMMALAGDLRAWVEGRGVGAYTSGVLYETRKWMARNKATTVAIASIAFLMIVSVALFIYLQQSNFSKLQDEKEATEIQRSKAADALDLADKHLATAQRNESEMERERDRAEREAEVAREQKLRADQLLEASEQNRRLAARRKRESDAAAYRSSINAAAFSLRLNEVDAVRSNLAQCPSADRGWEWRHLALAADPSLGDPIVVGGGVTDLDATRGGELLMTYGFGLKPRLWDVRERRSLDVDIQFPGFVVLSSGDEHHQLDCAASPDASIVAVTSPTDHTLRVINGKTGDEMYAFSEARSPIVAVDFSPDGRSICVGSQEGRAWVFGTSRARVTSELVGHEGAIHGLAFGPDGRRVATAGADGSLRVWEAASGEELLRVDGSQGDALAAVAWSPDGDLLASASFAGGLGVWRADDGAMEAVMHGHRGAVLDLAFSHEGTHLYSGGEDRTVRMWLASSGREVRVFNGHESEVRALVPLGAGRGIASVDLGGTVRLWDPRWDASITQVEIPPDRRFDRIAFDAAGSLLFAAGDGGSLEVFDADRARSSGLSFHPGAGEAEPGCRGFALARESGLVACVTPGGRVELHSTLSKGLVQVVDELGEDVERVAISQDGRVLAAVSDRNHLAILHRMAGTRVDVDLRHAVVSLAIDAEGERVVTAESDESLRIWEASSGRPLGSHRDAHSNRITDLAIRADGSLLASASNDGTARLWTLPALELFGEELEDHRVPVTTVAFSPTERRLATGAADGRVRLWSLDERSFLLDILADDKAILDLEFSPDGERLVATAPGGVEVWETGGAEERYRKRFRAGPEEAGSR